MLGWQAGRAHRALHPEAARRGVGWILAARIAIVAGLLIAVVLLVRYGGAEIPVLEAWVARQGAAAPLIFLAALVVLLPFFVPDSLFAIAAGLLFGLAWGSLIMFLGTSVAACLAFAAARWFLHNRVEALLQQHPKLVAIERAASGQGLRLQLLLRLSPINPMVVSYILGATQSRVTTFLIALAGLLPALFVETYFGAMAGHVGKAAAGRGEDSALHTGMLITGFVVCLVLSLWIGRLAYRAVTAVEEV